MNDLIDIVEKAKSGELSRDEYWRAMQAQYLCLRQYQSLIAGGDVASIDISADELRVVTREGIAMRWHPEDIRTAPNILLNHGAFEPGESKLLLTAAAGAKVVFDVGANAGYYSLHWCSRLHPEGRVHAFEPVPSTYSHLVHNVSLNRLDGIIRPVNIGLGDDIKTVSFFLPAFSGSVAASERKLHPDEQNIEVRAHIDTLDRYFEMNGLTQLDLMKIDVEGAELFVLRGGERTLARHKPLIFMELLRKWAKPFGYHPNDVISLLAGMGYCCFAVDEGKLTRFFEMTDLTEQTNFFFADPGKHGDWLMQNGLA
ncbi:MAG: FkbM family methyltransferase [Methylacidiphilales bacterium]|nr:FkbM family methyltransferase [Candidatus Methylacidiphilales bacterium]